METNLAGTDLGETYLQLKEIIAIIVFIVAQVLLWAKITGKFEKDIGSNKTDIETNATNIKHNYQTIKSVDDIVRDHDKDIAVFKDNIKGIHESSKEHKRSVGKIDDKLDQLIMNQGKG